MSWRYSREFLYIQQLISASNNLHQYGTFFTANEAVWIH